MAPTYHYGNLRQAILERALDLIAADGIEALSLRSVAVQLGVSHVAPRHHFASKQALLTAIAADGFAALADQLEEVGAGRDFLLDSGLAYVPFALEQPAAFAVMFTPTVLDYTDPALVEASGRAVAALLAGAGAHHPDAAAAGVAGWALVHGFASLALSGSLEQAGFAPFGTDLLHLAARSASLLGSQDGSSRQAAPSAGPPWPSCWTAALCLVGGAQLAPG